MGRYTLTTGADVVVATGAINKIFAPTDTLSVGDVITAPPGSHTALVLDDGDQFDLAAPQTLSGIDVVRDQAVGDSVITLRAGLDLTLLLGAENATVVGAANADRIVGGPAGSVADVFLGSRDETVRADGGALTVHIDPRSAGARIAGGGVATLALTGRYGDAVTLAREVQGVAELDVQTAGLRISLADAGIAAVALFAPATTIRLDASTGVVSDYAGGNTIGFAGAGETLVLPYASLDPYLHPDRLAGFAPGDAIDVDAPFGPAERLSYDRATGRLILSNPVSGARQVVMLPPALPGELSLAPDGGLPSGDHGTLIRLGPQPPPPPAAPCFAAGTRVLSEHGWTRVEALAVGDRLITTAGKHRRLRWIGWRTVDCRRHPVPDQVLPIRITADAFGPDLPQADVVLSPDHALLIEGSLIPVKYLVNGATILREPVAKVRYFHLELASHDVILAEGLPVETYLDTGNRHQFSNGAGHVSLHADFGAGGWSGRACAPLVTTGPLLRVARAQLLDHADALGHRMTHDPDLHLRADGQRVWGHIADGVWRGWIPPHTRTLRVCSRAAAPADCARDSDDRRRLGVAISRVVARCGTQTRELCAGDADWGTGFYPPESDLWACWRWTDGDAALAPALWRDLPGPVRLDFHIFRTITYRCDPVGPVAACA